MTKSLSAMTPKFSQQKIRIWAMMGKNFRLSSPGEALVDATPGVEIYPTLAPAPGEHVIMNLRYSISAKGLHLLAMQW